MLAYRVREHNKTSHGLLHYLLFAWKFMKASVGVHESFRGSFHRFHGSFHSFHESFHESHGSFHGSDGSFHCFRESFHVTYDSFHGKKPRKLPRNLSQKLPWKLRPRKFSWKLPWKWWKLPWKPLPWQLPRKYFVEATGSLRFTFMGASVASTEAQRLSRQFPRKPTPMEAFVEVITI